MAYLLSSPLTVEEIFKDYNARRSALVCALTSDVHNFYLQCDPEKENLCLDGHPNESWEVTMLADEVPPEVPEPALAINFSRDGMHRKDWLSLVALHSDCRLIAVAFYFGARLYCNERIEQIVFDPAQPTDGDGELNFKRKRLFSLINDLPTLFEGVTGRKPVKDRPSVDSGSKSRKTTKRSIEGQVRSNPKLLRKVLWRKKMMSTMKSFVGAVGQVTVLTSFGYVVTFVNDGTTASV